jgi:hypothetical protein
MISYYNKLEMKSINNCLTNVKLNGYNFICLFEVNFNDFEFA